MNKEEELAIAKMHERDRNKKEDWKNKHPLIIKIFKQINKFKIVLDNK